MMDTIQEIDDEIARLHARRKELLRHPFEVELDTIENAVDSLVAHTALGDNYMPGSLIDRAYKAIAHIRVCTAKKAVKP